MKSEPVLTSEVNYEGHKRCFFKPGKTHIIAHIVKCSFLVTYNKFFHGFIRVNLSNFVYVYSIVKI